LGDHDVSLWTTTAKTSRTLALSTFRRNALEFGVAWFARLEDVSGRDIQSYRDLRGYEQLDVRRLEQLRQKYGFDHVLVPSRIRARLKPLRQTFSNARWTVFDVRPQN
jgi:hypothetical protein